MPYLLFKNGSKPGKKNEKCRVAVDWWPVEKFSHPIIVMNFGFPNM